MNERMLVIEKTPLEGLAEIVPVAYEDDRGFFFESYNAAAFAPAVGEQTRYVQDNCSRSVVGVLRGLHYQLPPMAQGKLVQVVRGEVFDVAVDIRRSSPTFGDWHSVRLSDENHKQFWIPPGFAHGFLALSERVDLVYRVTQYYSPSHDRSIQWNDPDVGIEWPEIGTGPFLSTKDTDAPMLRNADVFE